MKSENKEYLRNKLGDVMTDTNINSLLYKYNYCNHVAKKKGIPFNLTIVEYYAFLLQSGFFEKCQKSKVYITLKDKSKGYVYSNLIALAKSEIVKNSTAKDWLVSFKNGDVITVRSLLEFYNTHPHYFNCSYFNIMQRIRTKRPLLSDVITSIKQIPENKV